MQKSECRSNGKDKTSINGRVGLLLVRTLAGVAAICVVSCVPSQENIDVTATSGNYLPSAIPVTDAPPTPQPSPTPTSIAEHKQCSGDTIYFTRDIYDRNTNLSRNAIYLSCIKDGHELFVEQVYDGSAITYEYDISRSGDLIVKESETIITYLQHYSSGSREILFTPEDNVFGVSWSPDGEHITYTRHTRAGENGISLETMHVASRTISTLYLAKVGIAAPELIVNLLPLATAWSPDGTKVATMSYIGGFGPYYHVGRLECDPATYKCAAEEIYELSLRDEYTGGYMPTWMNNSEQLVYICGGVSQTFPTQLCVVDLDGHEITRYDLSLFGIEGVKQGAISPDGKMMAVSGWKSEGYNGIYLIQLDTMTAFELATDLDGDKAEPKWAYPLP